MTRGFWVPDPDSYYAPAPLTFTAQPPDGTIIQCPYDEMAGSTVIFRDDAEGHYHRGWPDADQLNWWSCADRKWMSWTELCQRRGADHGRELIVAPGQAW